MTDSLDINEEPMTDSLDIKDDAIFLEALRASFGNIAERMGSLHAENARLHAENARLRLPSLIKQPRGGVTKWLADLDTDRLSIFTDGELLAIHALLRERYISFTENARNGASSPPLLSLNAWIAKYTAVRAFLETRRAGSSTMFDSMIA